MRIRGVLPPPDPRPPAGGGPLWVPGAPPVSPFPLPVAYLSLPPPTRPARRHLLKISLTRRLASSRACFGVSCPVAALANMTGLTKDSKTSPSAGSAAPGHPTLVDQGSESANTFNLSGGKDPNLSVRTCP